MFSLILLFAAAAVTVAWWSKAHGRAKGRLPLPPGPSGFPGAYAFRQFAEWTKEYGPVFSLRRGGKVTVVIGSFQVALAIMEKGGAHTADRPRNIVGSEIFSKGLRFLLLHPGKLFKNYRKAFHAHMNVKAVKEYGGLQTDNAQRLVLDILDKPQEHVAHAQRYAASVIMSIAYGKTTLTTYSDPEVQQIVLLGKRLGKIMRPGGHLVDVYPWLRYVPGYLSEPRQWQLEEMGLYMRLMDDVRRQVAAGDARPSFGKYLIEKQDEYKMSDVELAYLAGGMFLAGSDTTAAAISFVIMAAACNSDALKRVHEELDRVVGPDRLPTFDDEDSLPQLKMFMQESFRIWPVSAAGFAHATTQDIVWGGYCIPAGTALIGNHWSICRDPDVFPDPERFDPQRWADESSSVRDHAKILTFGFGRRQCPGQHLAMRSLFITSALLLWAFDIVQDRERPIDMYAMTDTAISKPMPFTVIFKERAVGRGKGVRELVRAAMKAEADDV